MRVRLRFFATEAGGYGEPFTVWPARIKLRFPERPNIHFGAALYGHEGLVVQPGETVELELKLLDEEAEKTCLQTGRHFPFGDLRDRGEGWVIAND